MTATDALHNMRTELAELEARQVLPPARIRAKREWIDAVEHQLKHHEQEVHRLKEAANQEHELRQEAELRTGMLANVLIILGFSPWQHLKCPLWGHTYNNPEVYQLAAKLMDDDDRANGRTERLHCLKYRIEMDGMLNRCLWHARLTLMLRPFQHLTAQHQHGQEERTAA